MHWHCCKVDCTWLPREGWQRWHAVAHLRQAGRSQVGRPLEAWKLLQISRRQLQLRQAVLQRLQCSIASSAVLAMNAEDDAAWEGTPEVPASKARVLARLYIALPTQGIMNIEDAMSCEAAWSHNRLAHLHALLKLVGLLVKH